MVVLLTMTKETADHWTHFPSALSMNKDEGDLMVDGSLVNGSANKIKLK